jgi:MFS family permease
VLLSFSYGIGSVFSLFGGRLGDKHSRKTVSLVGNLFIPLMSLSVLSPNLFFLGLLFVLGWWARYFRTPARRAWLVDVSKPEYRSKIFGFLHALDVGGGMFAVLYSVVLVMLNFPLRSIILLTALPILVSSICLLLAKTNKKETAPTPQQRGKELDAVDESQRKNSIVFKAILVSATLFGFSFYSLGFPVLTVSQTVGSISYGIIVYGIYLGISGFAGFLLGSTKGTKPLGTLWKLGYLLASFSSLAIGASYALHYGLPLYYLAAAGLGFATGSVETFEPVLTSVLVKPGRLSRGMGWLSLSRALGLFISNLIMGLLFGINQVDAYAYAFITSIIAAIILGITQIKTHMK